MTYRVRVQISVENDETGSEPLRIDIYEHASAMPKPEAQSTAKGLGLTLQGRAYQPIRFTTRSA